MDQFGRKLGERIKNIRTQLGLSQEELAERLKINRVAISQIENGQREVSAEEIARLSKIYHIPTDVLLDLKQEVRVKIEEKKELAKEPKKKRQEVRISVPQKNLEKFREVLLYILNKVGSKHNIGETVLYKLLYFVDFDFYEKYEEQLIGATYQKNRYGPTPVEFIKIIESMEDDEELVKVEGEYFKYPQRKYLPLREPDLKQLKANEVKLIDDVLDRLSDMNAQQISDYSHNDVPWLTTEDGDFIDYETVFYRTPPYSVRNYSEDDESELS